MNVLALFLGVIFCIAVADGKTAYQSLCDGKLNSQWYRAMVHYRLSGKLRNFAVFVRCRKMGSSFAPELHHCATPSGQYVPKYGLIRVGEWVFECSDRDAGRPFVEAFCVDPWDGQYVRINAGRVRNNYHVRCELPRGLLYVSCITRTFARLEPGKTVAGEDGFEYTCSRQPDQTLKMTAVSTGVPSCGAPMIHIGYVIDGSSSITPPGFLIFKEAIVASLDHLDKSISDNTTLTFNFFVYSDNMKRHGTYVRVKSLRQKMNARGFARTMTQVKEEVRSMRYPTGWTNTGRTLYNVAPIMGRFILDKPDPAVRIVILLTDGMATDPENVPGALKELTSRNVKVISVAVGEAISPKLTQELLTYSTNVFQAKRADELKPVLAEKVTRSVCSVASLHNQPERLCIYWALNDEPIKVSDFPDAFRCRRNRREMDNNRHFSKDPGCTDDKWQLTALLLSLFIEENCQYHPEAKVCFRSTSTDNYYRYHGIMPIVNQCCYRDNGELLLTQEGGGTVDKHATTPVLKGAPLWHKVYDVIPADNCRNADMWDVYIHHRPQDGTAGQAAWDF